MNKGGRGLSYTDEQNEIIFTLMQGRKGNVTEEAKEIFRAYPELFKNRTPRGIEQQYYRILSAKKSGKIGRYLPPALVNTMVVKSKNTIPAEPKKAEVYVLQSDDLKAILSLSKQLSAAVESLVSRNQELEQQLSTAINKVNYQKGRIQELEEDQQAYLTLMDKARAHALKQTVV